MLSYQRKMPCSAPELLLSSIAQVAYQSDNQHRFLVLEMGNWTTVRHSDFQPKYVKWVLKLQSQFHCLFYFFPTYGFILRR